MDIEIIQQGTEYSDSSFYDIIEVDDAYWIAGKYGILKSYSEEEGLQNIEYPNQGVDIYKMAFLDDETLIAAGDKGFLYFYDKPSQSWERRQIPGYEESCFYNLSVTENGIIFISGGNSKIAHSKKVIPQGFVLKSDDGGQTWEKTYSKKFKMVWSVKQNPFDKHMYALMYTLNKTHLFRLEGNIWVKQEKIGNSIFHDIQWKNTTDYVATGGWIGKKGRIYFNDSKVVMNHSGLIWSRVANKKYELYPACNGQIVMRDKQTKGHKMFKTNLNKSFSIYEAIFTTESEALAIGSARTLLKLSIKD